MPNLSDVGRGIFILAFSSFCSGHEAADATLWMQTSAEYRALVAQVYHQAQASLSNALAADSYLGAIENRFDAAAKEPAVVLDIDEAVLDNGPFQAVTVVRGQRGFDASIWNEWVKRHKAHALPGALDYVRAARGLGIEVFYVTNRSCSTPQDCPQQEATIRNLNELGFPDVDDARVLMKNEHSGWTSEKSNRRAQIARDYRIVQILGDDLGDFIPGARRSNPEIRLDMIARHGDRFGRTWYLFPNPLYGSWKKALGGSPLSHLEPDRDELCMSAYAPIGHIQGPGNWSFCTDLTVNTRGVVTLVSTGSSGLGGYFMQDAEGDGNAATADGIFVVDSDNQSGVRTGDFITIQALVIEHNGLTALEPQDPPAVTVLGRGQSVKPTPIRLPESFDGELERYEGMLISITQPMTVTGNRWLDDLGQLKLASANDQGERGRLYQPTHLAVAGSPEVRRIQKENGRRVLVLDDGQGSNPDPLPFITAPDGDATLRVGDQVAGILGVLDYGEVTRYHSGKQRSDYRVQITQRPTILPRNLRPPTPREGSRDLRIVNANVHGFFTNLGNGSCPRACDISRETNCRGALNDAEFRRQKAKLIAALAPLNADIYGFQEVQNNGFDEAGAIARLTQLLGDDFDYVRTETGRIGCDATSVGLVYRATVQPIGLAHVLSTGPFDASHEGASRAALAQVFEHRLTGERLTVVINHFVSRRALVDDASAANAQDSSGQGYWNLRRTESAKHLTKWLDDLGGRIDPDIVIIGNLNAYAHEDPLEWLERAGYVNLLKSAAVNQAPAYTYIDGGLSGALDHALVSDGLVGKTTASAWPINADEPQFLDYRLRDSGSAWFQETPFRSSDHDPIILEVTLGSAPP